MKKCKQKGIAGEIKPQKEAHQHAVDAQGFEAPRGMLRARRGEDPRADVRPKPLQHLLQLPIRLDEALETRDDRIVHLGQEILRFKPLRGSSSGHFDDIR
eukprot:scaffold298_cov247-Pinguiococcus_pyrenoidosus.AAC.44